MIKADKLNQILSVVFRVFLVLAVVTAFFLHNWFNFFMSLLTLFLTYLPSIFQKKFKVYYPSEFETMILIFIFGALYLGEVRGFYNKFWWWDVALHTSSGIITGFFAFSLVYVLNKELKSVNLSPFFIALFSFCFALAIGAAWEIFEFGFDNTFSANMQRRETGVFDTMEDLIVDSIGAFLISISCYFYLKKGKSSFLAERFAEKNSEIFKR